MIRLFIVDDHAIVRHGLKQLLVMVPDICVAGEASCGEELLLALKSVQCDVLLLDMNMPGLSGVELILQLRENHPVLPILVLSMHIEGQIASRALNAGASGYLTKDNEPEILMDAIRKIYSGGNYIDPVLVETLVFNREVGIPHESLSAREYQVFLMLVSGKSVGNIASELCLSIKTISTHKSRFMQKMNMQTKTELVRYAIRHRLIEG